MMIKHIISFSLCLLAVFFLISTFLCKLYLMRTIGRKFDKIFPYNPYGFDGKGFFLAGFRAGSYALYVITKGKTIKDHSNLAKQCYGDYDFNGNVTPRQRKACWAYFMSFILFCAFTGGMILFDKLCHI